MENQNDIHNQPPHVPGSGGAVPTPDRGATVSLVAGLLGLLFCPLSSVVAIITGHMANGRIRRSHGALSGEGQALAGLITGYIGIALGVLVLPIVAAIMIPAVSSVAMEAKVVKMLSNGKQIYTAVYVDALDGGAVGFPKTGQYATSTEYIQALRGKNPKGVKVLSTSPDFFAGPQTPPAMNWEDFGSKNNGWCFVEGFDGSAASGIPFALSANVQAGRLSELKGRVGDSFDDPRSRLDAIVVFHGGVARKVDPNETWESVLTPGLPDAKILRP